MLTTERNNPCHFCGEANANAVWMGSTCEIFCCSICAQDILPQFIADAIVGSLDMKSLKDQDGPTIKVTKENEILLRFHSAFNSALIRKIRATENFIQKQKDNGVIGY